MEQSRYNQLVYLLCGLTFSLWCADQSFAEDWNRFRGPNGSGIASEGETVPLTWGPTENLAWRAELPGPGVSCPIISQNHVYVTCYTGYGIDRREPGNPEELVRHLICLDRKSGKIIWQQSVPAVLPEDPYTGMGVPEHGYASHTPVADNEGVYVFFGKSGVYAYTHDGKQRWHRDLGKDSDPRRWGTASSPILVDGKLIVTAGPEGRAIFALDCSTGEEVWKAEANSLGNVWGTPIVVPGPEGRTDIVIGAPYEVWGLNAETGRLSWYCEAVPEDSYSSSVVLSEGLIYGISGRQGGSFAIRAGGTGEITETHRAWTGRDRNRYSTPVVVKGRLYHISSNIVACLNAQTGEEIYRERLSGAPESSGRGFSRGGNYTSPVAVGEHLFYVSDQGETYVLKLGDQFEQVAVNRVTENSETFAATPAIDQGAILIRSDRAVYCIENK